jgi:hypothetical protein
MNNKNLDECLKTHVKNNLYLSIDDYKIVKKVYEKTSHLLDDILSGDLENTDFDDMITWTQYVLASMNVVEELVKSGDKRREVLIVCLKTSVDMNESINDNIRKKVYNSIDNTIPRLIRVFIIGSKDLKINKKKLCMCFRFLAKFFCCC